MPPLASAVDVGDRLLAFAASLLVGGAAIHAGAHVAAETRSYAHAVLTALLGALVWALFEPVPLVGSLLALVAWVALIKWRYRGGWLRAALVGGAAWAAAVVALAALELLGLGSVSALGVPGA